MCRVPHYFCPISGDNGMQNIGPTTDELFTKCEKTLKTGCDELHSMFEKMSRELCLHLGRLIYRMKIQSGEGLTQIEVKSITQFVYFSMYFTELQYRQTYHGLKHLELFRLTKWLKNTKPARYSDEGGNINKCTTSFQDVRISLFGHYSTVFEHVQNTSHVQ